MPENYYPVLKAGEIHNNTSRTKSGCSQRKRGDEEKVRVVGFFGGNKSKITWVDMDIAVCTIEKVGC